jgi:hypothetical protein
MITKEQIENLKSGDKLIFYRRGGVLSSSIGNVFTFANWIREDDKYNPGKHLWQCKELHELGNREHNFLIYDTELFDEKIHNEFVMMDEKKLVDQQNAFIEKYGE